MKSSIINLPISNLPISNLPISYNNFPLNITLNALSCAVLLAFASFNSYAQLPSGSQIFSGNANIVQNGNTLNIQQQSNNLGVHWQTFNIGAGNTVNFIQPNQNSIAYNNVLGNTRSEIYGTLNANGRVFFANPNGFLFAPSSVVNVGSIIASTRKLSEDDFIRGNYTFSGESTSELIFQGNLRADNGNIVLLANKVKNSGDIRANRGKVVLAAADSADISLDQDNRVNIRLNRQSIDALVENRGLIAADGGQVLLTARGREMATKSAIWNIGTLQAKSLDVQNGVVILDAGNAADSGKVQVEGKIDVSGVKGGDISISGEKIAVKDGASIDASGANGGGNVRIGGDWQGQGTQLHAKEVIVERGSTINASATEQGSGGKVVLWSTEKTNFSGSITANAAKQGDGGQVETSSKKTLNVDGRVEAKAQNGKNGQWLLDPTDIWVVAEGTGSSPTGSTVTNTSIQNTLNTGGDVTLTTTSANSDQGNVGILESINKSAGSSATLTINADGNVGIFNSASIASTSNELNLTINAGNEVFIPYYSSPTIINNNGGSTTFNAASYISLANTNFTNSNSINFNSSSGDVIFFGVTANTSSGLTATATAGNIAITNNLTTTGNGQLTLSASSNVDLGGKTISSGGDVVIAAGAGTAAGTVTGGTVANFTLSNISVDSGKTINISSAGSTADATLAEKLRGISKINGATVQTGTLNYNTASSSSNKGTAPLNIYLRDKATADITASRKYDGTTDLKSGDISSKTLTSGSTDDRIAEGGTVVAQISNKNAGSRTISSVKIINDNFSGGVNGYTISDTSAATITARAVSLTAEAKDKVYDGNTSSDGVVVVGGDGFVTGEATTSQTYSDKNVATGAQTINPNYTLVSGTEEGNYVVSKTTATGQITARTVTATAGNDSKIYDGTTTANSGTVTLNNFIAADDAAATQTFNDKNVLAANSTVVGDITFANTDARLSNYSISKIAGTGTITAKALTATASNESKTYDGTRASTGTVTFTGFIGSESASGIQEFNSSHVSDTTATKVVGIIAGDINTNLTNYAITPVDGVGSITARPVTTTAGNDSKVYDGTTTANTGTVTLNNFIAADGAAATQTFNDKNVLAANSTVVGDITFTNTDARLSDYSISKIAGTGTITAKALTATASNESKTYDGTRASTGTVTFTGFIGSESASGIQEFNSSHVSDTTATKVVSIAGDINTNLTNYAITPVDGVGSITARAVTATAGNDSKVYDGTTAANTGTVTLNNFIAADDAAATQTFNDKNVLAANSTVVGDITFTNPDAQLSDYTISKVNGVGSISKRQLSLTAQTESKKYDGSTTSSLAVAVGGAGYATGEGGTASQTYDNKDVGTRNLVVSNTLNSGTDAANYDITTQNATGTITKRQVTIVAQSDSKKYDGTTSSSINASIGGDGFASGEGATTSQSFDSKDAGSRNIIASSTLNSGTDAANYDITTQDASGTITKRQLVITAQSDNKIYDGTTTSSKTATVGGDGYVSGDSGSATQVFDDKNAGTRNLVASHSFATGTTASNYDVTSVIATGTIDKRQLTVTASNEQKTYDGTTNSTSLAIINNFVIGEGGSATQKFQDYHAGTTNTEVDQVSYNTNTLASNYTENKVLGSGQIDRRRVTVTAGNDSKVYDGTNAANTGRATLDNFISSDSATASQVFNSSHVKSTSKTIVNQLNFANSSARISDYEVTYVEGNGQITPRLVNVIATNSAKMYDRTTNSLATPVVENILPGDSLTGLTQYYDSATVGTDKSLIPSFTGVASASLNSDSSDYNFNLQANKSATIIEDPNLDKDKTTPTVVTASTTTINDNTIVVKPVVSSPEQLLEARSQLFSSALQALESNPELAAVEDCTGNLDNCIALPLKTNTNIGEARIKNRIAIMIGINDYISPIPDLSSPTNDIREIGSSLNRQYGYQVKQLRNADKSSILAALNELIMKADPSDSVVLMYAGHGIQKKGKAYWIPADATYDKPDNWIDHDDINRALSRIPSRQILLISDSCYSGALTKEFQVDVDRLANHQEILLRRSVMVMSSGNIEPVEDEGTSGHSAFAYSLIKTINSAGDLRFGSQVFQEISKQVQNATGQTPQYGAAVSAGYMQGGEFLFAPEENSSGKTQAPPGKISENSSINSKPTV